MIVVALGCYKEVYCRGNETNLFIHPSDITSTVNSEFDIHVKLSNVQNLFAVAFDVAYDTSLMTFHSITEGNFLNENGQAQTFFLYSVQAGKVIVAISRTDTNEPGVSSENDIQLATLRFTAIHHGSGEIKLENTGLMEPDLSNIAHETQSSSIRVIAPPKILNIPDVTLTPGDTLQLHLNEYVEDPDSPVDQLYWEVMEANHLDYTIDNEFNILKFWIQSNTEQTRIKLKVSDPDGLSDTTSFNVIMPAGIGDNFHAQPLIRVYPNPFRDRITIESSNLNANYKHVTILIYDEFGQVNNIIGNNMILADYAVKNNTSNELHVNLSSLPAGLYVLKIKSNNNYHNIKIIKTN
jgi:hypothetical protein